MAPKSAAIMMVEGVNAPPKEEAWVIGLCLPVSLLEQGPQGCFSDVLRLVAAILVAPDSFFFFLVHCPGIAHILLHIHIFVWHFQFSFMYRCLLVAYAGPAGPFVVSHVRRF